MLLVRLLASLFSALKFCTSVKSMPEVGLLVSGGKESDGMSGMISFRVEKSCSRCSSSEIGYASTSSLTVTLKIGVFVATVLKSLGVESTWVVGRES